MGERELRMGMVWGMAREGDEEEEQK